MENSHMLLCLFIVILSFHPIATDTKCTSPLGMEDMRIPDSSITAPTWLYYRKSYNLYYRPYHGRLNYQTTGGGWCSEGIDEFPDQYLQIDLGRNTRLTSIATQGRGTSDEYVDQFGLMYKREGDRKYRKHTENGRWKIMVGNNDTKTIVKNTFTQPFIARWVRIVPRGNLFAVYCLRTELYGCEWKKSKDTLVHYISNYGMQFKSHDYRDTDYDGTISSRLGLVTDGLGKLTDDVYGGRLPESGSISKWIAFGVKRPILSFKFAKTRIFHSVIFHVYNLANDVRIFSKVDVEVSLEGANFSVVASYRTTDSERKKKGTFSIRVNLSGVISRYIKCHMAQLGSVIMVSEVDFTSEPYTDTSGGGLQTVKPTGKAINAVTTPSKPNHRVTWKPVINIRKRKPTKKPRVEPTVNGWRQSFGRNTYEENTGSKGLSFPIIIAIVLGSIVALGVLVLLVVRECKRHTHKHKHKPVVNQSEKDSKAASELLSNGKIQLAFKDTPYIRTHSPGYAFSPIRVNAV